MSDKKTSQTRLYTVVKVDGPSLYVLHDGIESRSQEHACEQVVQTLPVEQQNAVYAAFLTGAYREFSFVAEQQVRTTSVPREPSFATGVTRRGNGDVPDSLQTI